MALSDEQREIIKALEREAKLRREISSSIESYVEAVKDSKKLSEEIANLNRLEGEYQQKITASLAAGDHQAYIENLKIVSALQEQSALLTKNKKILDDTIKSVDKYKLLVDRGLTKSMIGLGKAISNLPNIVEGGLNKLRGFGLFEMDKAIRTTALNIGLAGKQSDALRVNIKSAAENSIMFGANMQEIAQYQAQYSEETGRALMLGQKSLESIAEIAKGTGLGSEGAAQMAASFEQQGISAERTKDFVEAAVNKAAKMGLNSSKVIKNMQSNMKLLNRYNFKGGVKGLQRMAETTTKLGIDMDSVSGMADKLFDIEGAVEMSAQLQVMGGAWAQMSDPFKLMYMARNDMAGLTEEVAKAAATTATFNSKTGDFDISAMQMNILRKVAEATGVSLETLTTAAKNAAKFTKIKGQISFNADPESKEFLENTAQLDKEGKAYIEMVVDGKSTKRYLNQLDNTQLKNLMAEDKKLKERAEAAMTFDDTLKAAIDRFKMALLPLIESFGKEGGLIDGLQKFIKKAETDGWFKKIGEFAETVGKLINTVGKFILEWPRATLGLLLLPKVLELAFGAYKWYEYGKILGQGFLSTTGGAGGAGGFGTRNMSAMNRMGLGTMGKFGANFKGALGSAGTIAGGVLSGAIGGYSEYSEQKEKGKTTSEAVGRGLLKGAGAGLGAWGGAAAGASLGAFGGPLAPVTVPLGALIGGGLGALGGGYFSDLDTYGVKDGIFGGTQKRAIMQGGRITPIDNKDDILAMKPGGIVDNMMNKNTGPNIVKHEFGELNINGNLVVTTPGNQSFAVDLLKDPIFISELNQKLTKEIERSINQKNTRG